MVYCQRHYLEILDVMKMQHRIILQKEAVIQLTIPEISAIDEYIL